MEIKDDIVEYQPSNKIQHEASPTEVTALLIDKNIIRDNYVDEISQKLLVEDDLNLEYTYWIMKKRQYERILNGTVPKPKSFTYIFVWMLLFMVTYGTYLFLQIWYFKRERQDGYKLEFILMGFISVSSGVMCSRFNWLPRLIIFELYSFCFVFFIEDLYYKPKQYLPIGGVFFGSMILTIFIFIMYPYLLRFYLMCTGSVKPKLTSSTSHVDEGYRIEVATKGWFSSSMTCVYQGQIFDGKPNGLGIWIDTSAQGEFLEGIWKDGIPIGPFQSVENGTKSMLTNLRIFFATNAGGESWTDRIGLHFGVASVECCVSGNFLKNYPIVNYISPPKECECKKEHNNQQDRNQKSIKRKKFACKCISQLIQSKSYRHIDDDKVLKSVNVAIDKRALTVTGFKSSRKHTDRIVITIDKSVHPVRLSLDEQWISSGTSEGLLFIHGYDHNLKDSLKRFAQFLALGHFPSHIKPFVFNWPSASNPLFYWCAHNVASDNDIHRDLKQFIRSMKDSGIKHLHIMCHSMGTRFFLRAFNTIKDVFTVKLMSPNTSFHEDLNIFAGLEKEPIGSIPMSPAVSPRNSFSFANSDSLDLVNLVLLNPDYELETFKNDYYEMQPYCNKITIYADKRDEAIRLAFKMTSKQSLGNNVNPLVDSRGRMLDLDLIDTSDLDRNTSSSFHSFFNVNRLMVDDLWELVVTGKRAEARYNRLKKWGNVYRFTILPSSVVMV